MDGLTSQMRWISETLVSRLFGLNVVLPVRFERAQGRPTPADLQLSDDQLLSVKLPNAWPRNVLPPSRGTMFTRRPPWPISAESAPVMKLSSSKLASFQ
jgi:hypothetical protein